MICYSCGEFTGSNNNEGQVCSICAMHYYEKCTINLDSCYTCGNKIMHTLENGIRFFNPTDQLSVVTVSEKRGASGTKVKIECAFTIARKDGMYENGCEHKALIKEISRSGICIYSLTLLETGQKLSLDKCPGLMNYSLAVVRWVRRINHKI